MSIRIVPLFNYKVYHFAGDYYHLDNGLAFDKFLESLVGAYLFFNLILVG